MKKKYINVMIIMMMFFFNLKHVNADVEWITASGGGEGLSTPYYLPHCVGSMEGCGGMSQNFEVRVTLVDENNEIYPGTKTVGFVPLDAPPRSAYEDRGSDEGHEKSMDVTLDIWYWQNYTFVGSNVAKKYNGSEEDYMDEPKTEIYAIPMSYFCQPDDWSCYNQNRDTFFEDAKNLSDDYGNIYVPEAGRTVSFMSFFLKKCGFTDVWNGMSDRDPDPKTNTIHRIVDLVKNQDKQMKLMIEPVYSMNVTQWGAEHYFKGTAKQLSLMLYHSNSDDFKWFWPPIKMQNMYNLYNNMYDVYDGSIEAYIERSYEDFNLLKEIEELIASLVTYNEQIMGCNTAQYGKNEIGGYGNRYGSTACSESGKLVQKTKTEYTKVKKNELYVENAKPIFNDIARPYGLPGDYSISAMGIATINLTGDLMNLKEYKKNNCEYTITTCNNNDFEFKSELKLGSGSDGELFECIYPSSVSGIEQDQLKTISMYDEVNDLWCYDDVDYSFSNIMDINASTKKIKNSQIINVPDGTLTIKRTCFSKKDINAMPIASINSLFETNTNEKYQKEFDLTLNGEQYTYKRDNNYTVESAQTQQKTSKNGEQYYEYNSTLKYKYKLAEGFNLNDGLNINVNNYAFLNGMSNNKTINFVTAYEGSAIVTKSIKEGKYTNYVSTEKNNTSTKLNNALGLSNRLYSTLSSESVTTNTDASKVTNQWEKEIMHDSGSLEWTNKYTLKEQIGNSCSFETYGAEGSTQFRVISLSNPFPGRDGISRMPGENWLSGINNNVYEYIQNNRNVNSEQVYQQEPLYTVTLDITSMIKIREYNKSHSYSDYDIICETGTGRMCKSDFLRDTKYIKQLEGTCANITEKEITKYNNEIDDFKKTGCNISPQCMLNKAETVKKLDTNKDGNVDERDYLNAEFYTCADKTAKSGG